MTYGQVELFYRRAHVVALHPDPAVRYGARFLASLCMQWVWRERAKIWLSARENVEGEL